MLGRTFIPQSESFERFIPGIYPKLVPVRILLLPSLCQDQEIQELLDLPDSTPITSVRHHTDEIDGMHFYNGRASAMIRLTSKEHEAQLRQWSIHNHEHGTLQWNEIPIYAFIPALHQCYHYKEHKRPFHGHDLAWCRYAKADEQQRTITPSNNRNQEISVPPSNQAIIPENTAPTIDETNAMNKTADETSDSNQDGTDNQEDIDTDNEEDDDSQRPWQTAPTHPRKILSATKTQSQPSKFDKTKRKADHNKAPLFTTKNLVLQMPAPKKKKKKPTK